MQEDNKEDRAGVGWDWAAQQTGFPRSMGKRNEFWFCSRLRSGRDPGPLAGQVNEIRKRPMHRLD
jgi:hypothetical protein